MLLIIDNGLLTINNVEIFDMTGKKQLSMVNYPLSMINYPLSINQMDISHLPAGIYFVRIQTEKEMITEKIIKQ